MTTTEASSNTYSMQEIMSPYDAAVAVMANLLEERYPDWPWMIEAKGCRMPQPHQLCSIDLGCTTVEAAIDQLYGRCCDEIDQISSSLAAGDTTLEDWT